MTIPQKSDSELKDGRKILFIWLHLEALDYLRGNPNAALVYLHIIKRAGHDGKCWQSIGNLAEDCGISLSVAKRALSFLVRTGMISRESRAGKTSNYSLTSPEKWKNPPSDLASPPPKSDPAHIEPGPNMAHLPGPNMAHLPGPNMAQKLDPIELDPNELDPSVYSSRKSATDFYTPGTLSSVEQPEQENPGIQENSEPGKKPETSVPVKKSEISIERERPIDEPKNLKKGRGGENFSSDPSGERSTSAPDFAPRSVPAALPRESALIQIWNAKKAKKWRAMALGSVVGTSILGLQSFMVNANGDPDEALKLIERCIELAAEDNYLKGLNLRSNQALDPNSQVFLGHFVGDALLSLKVPESKPVHVPATPAPVEREIKPTFYFDKLMASVREQLQSASA